MLAWGTIVLAASGGDLGYDYSHTHLPLIWMMLPYGLVVNALWDLPLYGWLILVSAWARKATFVWAIGPWLALMAFEWMAFQTFHTRDLLGSRLFGGFELAYTIDGKTTIHTLSQVTPMRWLANPGLWIGLVVGLACFAACVRLRRRNDPI
jgi:ABC-2 type transport system permease protein